MAITQYYVDPAIAGNSGTGTIGDPFGDLQYALDTVGAGVGRNDTDGDQFNIKAGTAEILAAPLTLATYGTPTAAGPLILRGYTAAANDGGVGEIDCGGFTMWANKTYDYIVMAYLEIHTFGDNTGIYLDVGIVLFRCEVHRGASAPNNRWLVYLGSDPVVIGCYLHDPGTGTSHCLECIANNNTIIANFIHNGSEATSYAVLISGNANVVGNIVQCAGVAQDGMQITNPKLVLGNIVYNSAAGTGRGIYCSLSNLTHVVMNNIIVGFSGIGGDGIQYVNVGVAGHNAFYNNTAPYTVSDQTFLGLTANDVTLAADPFTNAAGGDFSLTAAAKTALASKGFPVDYLGAAAATVSNLNIGPIQLAATAPVAATRGRLIIPRR